MPRAASLALSVAIMLLSACAVWNALEWPWKAKLFPLAIGVPLFVLAGAEALWEVFGSPAPVEARDLTLPDDVPVRDTALAAGWIGGFFAAVTFALFYGLFDSLLHLPFPAGWILEWLGVG